MTNEERIVILLSRITFEDRTTRQIKALLKVPISWHAVYRLSLLHGVASLLYHNFEKLDLRIPHEEMKKFELAYLTTLSNNVRLHHELEKILTSVVNEGTEVIALKGTPLCLYLYEGLGLRPSGDIDLLVRLDDLVRLSPLFRSMGYLPKDGDLQGLLQRNWFKAGFLKNNGFPVSLEIHWNWAQPTRARPNMDLVWKRSQISSLGSLTVRLLSLEDLLLYLCTHLSYHSFELRLIWICDIYEIIHQKGSTLDWAYICGEAHRQRLQTPFFVVLNYLKDVFGTDIPTALLKKTKVSRPRRAYLNVFLDPENLGYFKYPMDFWKKELFRLFLIDRPLDRLLFGVDVLRNRL